MRISDWSSDVCSSDLIEQAMADADGERPPLHWLFHIGHCGSTLISRLLDVLPGLLGLREPLPLLELAMRSIEPDSPTGRVSRDTFEHDLTLPLALLQRGFADTTSEERRVGKEIFSPVKSRWSPY